MPAQNFLLLLWLVLVAVCVRLGSLFYVGHEDSAGAEIARLCKHTQSAWASIATATGVRRPGTTAWIAAGRPIDRR